MDEQPSGGAPPVVAVVVTRDPGPWLEESLLALANQDYPNLSILVIDAASADDPTRRVAAVVPGAYVRRLAADDGYAAGANEVLSVVEGASHFVFCHDDVVPDPDAVRQLVEEAFRSNAGVVGPKLTMWDHADQLLGVGLAVDKFATAAGLVERGELDQEQHDAVRDVFAVSGACMLVRADLFSSIGGFSAALGNSGEDVDLCWRAQIAGARVVFCPDARVRHLEAGHRGMRATAPDRTVERRNRLRTMLTSYGFWHLVRVLPQAIVLAGGEAIFGIVTGDLARTREITRSWGWNLRRWGAIRATRKAVHRSRALGDGEVRRLQVRGSTRLSAFLRAQADGEGAGHSMASVGRDIAGSFRRGSLRVPMAVWTLVALVLVVGSRHLLADGVPAVGQLAPFGHGPGQLLKMFVSGWRTSGLGSNAAQPTAFGLLGLGGLVFLGGMGLLRQVLILGAIPLGAIGAYRLARPFGGRNVRLAALVVYAAVPVPYDSLARGRWAGVVMYAAAPFLVRRLLAASGVEPFAPPAGPGFAGRGFVGRGFVGPVVGLGVLLAVVGAFVPAAPLVVVVVAIGIVLGSVLVGDVRAALRSLAAAALAAVIAALLLFPWSTEVLLPDAGWASFAGVARPLAHVPSLGDILRFDTGPIGSAPLGWGFLVAAALPLLIGRGWRLAWAVRLWSVALVCWAAAWAGGRGWLGMPVPVPEVLLAPAAAATALAIALGVVAFVIDLPGYAFGHRQVVALIAAAGVALAAIPVLAAAPDGRWRMAATDDTHLLGWMPAEQESGAFRVLWVGSPDVLPLDGWRLASGVAYATSRNGPPDVTDLWPPSASGATELVGQALDVARRGRTTRLGHLLAPMGIRYLVLPARAAPGATGPAAPAPADVRAALQGQLDLKQVPGDPSLLLYENVAWTPQRSVLPAAAVEPSRSHHPQAAGSVDLAGADPVLGTVHGPSSFAGPVSSGQEVLFGEAASSRWALSVGGHRLSRRTAFGWANAFTVDRDGVGSLRYRTPVSRYLALAVELVLWVLAIRLLVSERSRRRSIAAAGGGAPGSGEPAPLPGGDGSGPVTVPPPGGPWPGEPVERAGAGSGR